VDDQHSGATLLRPAIDPVIPRSARDLLLAQAGRAAPPGLLPLEPQRRLATVSGATTGLTAGMVVAVTGAAPWAIGVLIFQGAVTWQSATGRWALMVMEMIVMVTMMVFGTQVARFGHVRTRYAIAATRSRYRDHYVTDADLDALQRNPVTIGAQFQVVADVDHRRQEADFLRELLADALDPLEQFAVRILVDERNQPVADFEAERVDHRHVVPAGFGVFGRRERGRRDMGPAHARLHATV